MNTELETVWRDSALWPADSESVLAQARAGILKGPSGTGRNDRNSVFHRYDNVEELDGGKLCCLEALSALDADPSAQTANAAYRSLSAFFFRPYFTSDKPNGSEAYRSTAYERVVQDGNHPVRGSFLQYIVSNAPDEAAVLNALLFMNHTGRPIAPDVLLAFAEGGSWLFADRAALLIEKSALPTAEKLSAVYRIALAGGSLSEGCFVGALDSTGQKALKQILSPAELREMQDFVLKRLFVNFRPGVAHYVIDDYVDHIQNYLELGDLLGALKADAPPAWLIAGALETFYELATGYERGVIWRDAQDDLMEKEALFVLISHLKDRDLDWKELTQLERVYDYIFAESLQSAKEGAPCWFKGKDEDTSAARAIRAVFAYPPNKRKLDAVLSDPDGAEYKEAEYIIEALSAEDPS